MKIEVEFRDSDTDSLRGKLTFETPIGEEIVEKLAAGADQKVLMRDQRSFYRYWLKRIGKVLMTICCADLFGNDNFDLAEKIIEKGLKDLTNDFLTIMEFDEEEKTLCLTLINLKVK